MTSELVFTKLALKNWRQFSNVDLQIHPRLTIITGSNGAGKSTILNLFTQHFGFNRPYLSTPKPNKTGGFYYDIGIWNEDESDNESEASISPPPPSGKFVEVGSITYSSGVESSIGLYENYSQAYGIQIQSQQEVSGVHIGSHRFLTNYQPIQNISLQPMRATQAYSMFNQEILSRFGGGHSNSSPTYRMKEALIGMAAFGEGNTYLQADKEILDTFEGFVRILKRVLPEEIGFEALLIRIPDVVLKTKSGDFLLDSASGGVNALIEVAWQIYLFSKSQSIKHKNGFVVTIDEPENHLHPSMQQAIIPNLLNAFPDAQFIVATHSPFVVSAVEDSAVYVLNYTGKSPSSFSEGEHLPDKRRVSSVKLDRLHKGGSAAEILREVLGVSVTIPQWVQDKIEEIVQNYKGIQISNEMLNSLRDDLSAAGFGELYPEALSKLVTGQ